MAVFVEFCYSEKHQHSTEEKKKKREEKGARCYAVIQMLRLKKLKRSRLSSRAELVWIRHT